MAGGMRQDLGPHNIWLLQEQSGGAEEAAVTRRLGCIIPAQAAQGQLSPTLPALFGFHYPFAGAFICSVLFIFRQHGHFSTTITYSRAAAALFLCWRQPALQEVRKLPVQLPVLLRGRLRILEPHAQDPHEGLKGIIPAIFLHEAAHKGAVHEVLRCTAQPGLECCILLLAHALQHLMQVWDVRLGHPHREGGPVDLGLIRLVHVVTYNERHTSTEGDQHLPVAKTASRWCQAEACPFKVMNVVLVVH
eukprot:CAMPEP_0202910870 /NCGR_PEP_ID=MMETSP1392-20130828/53267_1 /ASSEMBLY_ACC=CAM_ASM_000868 /TAXON_ID=225041 /ORGANISM="Chlamydomonas chlamydogama, Strain SAG 11-48b" /LENGTH=247 /DNA_ID=CAMNT_0049601141 /DNA_START=59 /DNA_END=803 /DNA_ORIENTATION=+